MILESKSIQMNQVGIYILMHIKLVCGLNYSFSTEYCVNLNTVSILRTHNSYVKMHNSEQRQSPTFLAKDLDFS